MSTTSSNFELEYLKQSGLLEGVQDVMEKMVETENMQIRNGKDLAAVYEFAANELERFGKQWTSTHPEARKNLNDLVDKHSVRLKFEENSNNISGSGGGGDADE